MKSKSAAKSEAAPRPPRFVAQPPQETPGREQVKRPSLTLKQILVPVDFSDCSLGALEYALALASRFEAKILLLHVVEPAVSHENYLTTPATVGEANQNLLAAGRERLATVRHKAVARGFVAETLVRMGRAQSEITDTAEATGTDLIVMGTRGYSGFKQVLLGGTAERVVRQAPCPVLTVRHPEP